MSDNETANRTKRGRPKVGATLVGVRIEPQLLAALDRFAAEQASASRPDAIRTLVQDHLIGLGYLDAQGKGCP